MGIFKNIGRYLAPILAFGYFSFAQLFLIPANNITNYQLSNNPKKAYTLIEKKQNHNVKRGESLWGIAKQYLPENPTDIEIRNKVKNIQKFSGLKPTRNNDNIKYINGKRDSGQDGLIDIIRPEQKLTVESSYELKYNNHLNNTLFKYNKSLNKRMLNKYNNENIIDHSTKLNKSIDLLAPNKRNNKNYFLISAFLISAFVIKILKKKNFFSNPPDFSKRFSIRKVRSSGLEDKLNLMLEDGKSYSDVSEFIKEKAYMPISKTTYYRYRKLTNYL